MWKDQTSIRSIEPQEMALDRWEYRIAIYSLIKVAIPAQTRRRAG